MKKYIPYIVLSLVLITSIVFNIFFAIKISSQTDEQIFNNTVYSIVEIKASAEDVGESFGTGVIQKGIFFEHWHTYCHKGHCLFGSPYIQL